MDSVEAARRRAEMRARVAARDHAAARSAYAATVPILAALDAAGEAYRSGGYDLLGGAANRWAHDPRDGLREGAVRGSGALRSELIGIGTAEVTLVLRSEALVIEAGADALLRHLDAVLETAGRPALALIAGARVLVVERGRMIEGVWEG